VEDKYSQGDYVQFILLFYQKLIREFQELLDSTMHIIRDSISYVLHGRSYQEGWCGRIKKGEGRWGFFYGADLSAWRTESISAVRGELPFRLSKINITCGETLQAGTLL
jgi:hypothetical protein